MRRFLTAVAVLALAACAPTLIQANLAATDEPMATAMLAPGTGTIKGSALIRQNGGTVVTCAGNDVYLIPGTPSGTSEMRRIFGDDHGYVANGRDPVIGGGKVILPPNPNRKAVCNAQGFFTFPNVRSGSWYVLTKVEWQVGNNAQGGALLGHADMVDGQEVDVVLTAK